MGTQAPQPAFLSITAASTADAFLVAPTLCLSMLGMRIM